MNVPALNDNSFLRFRNKLSIALLGILGPDFLMVLALGQWESARRSVKVSPFHKPGFTIVAHANWQRFNAAKLSRKKWTMKHAFFADMGGYLLISEDYKTPFPINGDQLFFLVSNDYVELPDIDDADIDDKNKRDGLARCVIVRTCI